MASRMDTATRKRQIAEAALAVVAEHGVGGMTVARVARLIGLVPSAIYRHFADRTAIVDAVMDLLRERSLANVTAARTLSDNPLAVLRLILMRQVGLVTELRSMPRILFSDEVYGGGPERRAAFRDTLLPFITEVAQLITEAQRAGMVRDAVVPMQAALHFMGLYVPLMVLSHTSEGLIDVMAYADANWRVFERGLCADAAERREG